MKKMNNTLKEQNMQLALRLAGVLHEINNLQPLPKSLNTEQEPIKYGYTLIWVNTHPQIYITLNHHKLCQQNLYPTPSPITLQLTLESDTPLGKNRQILSAIAACITHLFEWILEEYEIYKDFHPLPVSDDKLREYIEELWLQGKTLNNLTPQKIQPLKKPLPDLHQTLEKGLQAVQDLPDTHLTVRQYLKSICIEAYTDTTDKTLDQITQQAHRLTAQATKALQKLAQQYPPQQTNPCKTRHHHIGPWTIATW